LDEGHFYARLKYAELFQMLDLLPRAEAETRKALDLAHNGWEFSMARKQLHAIRQSLRERAQATGDWSKFVTGQCLLALVALYMFIIAAIVR
jgi:hypothetical protein